MSSEDSNSIKRRRVARACDTCRRKKVRCDGVQPGSDPPSCTNCKAYGYECAFIDAPKKRGPPKGYIEALETRLQRMESILGGLVQSGDLPEGTISSNLEWINVNESNFRSNQESINSTGSRLRKIPSTSTSGNNLRSGRSSSSKSLMTPSGHNLYKNNNQNHGESAELFTNDNNEYSGSQYDLNDSMGQLAMDESGHTKYLGNSSGVFLLKITKKVTNGQIISMPTPTHPLKRIGQSIVLELPPKELCDKLLDIYFKEIHPFLPFIDKEDLMEKYNNLEANYPSIILLYAIFSMTAKRVDPAILQAYSEQFAGSVFYAKARELLKDEFDNPSIAIVQALILMSFQITGVKDSASWVYIGLAIRLAQDMGLHRDSSKWNFDARQSELRRRVWWICFVVDRIFSACLGRPLLINEADCDVDLPVAGKLPDDDDEGVEGWVEFIKCVSILGRILNHVYTIKSKSSQGNVETVLASLDNELNEWKENLPKKLQYESSLLHCNEFNITVKILIHLIYCTSQILLHRPHIRGPKSKAPPSSIPSLTICTMAANNITHVLYRGVKDGNLKLLGTTLVYPFLTAATMHIINALSGDDRFREVAKHGLRMTLKCLDHLTEYWFATEKLSNLIRDLLKSREIELDGYLEPVKSNPQPSTTSKKHFNNNFCKTEDEGSSRTFQLIDGLNEQIRPLAKITFAPSLKPELNQQQMPTQTYPVINYQQQNMMNNNDNNNKPTATTTTTTKSSCTQSPLIDAMQLSSSSSSPESTTSSSSGFMQFTEYLTADSGLFPPNADAFNQDSSFLFDIDDSMDNNNPFLSLPSVTDWNDWNDWTEYLLRMQSLRSNTTPPACTLPTNPVANNPNMQNATAAVMNAQNIPSMAGNNNNMTY